MQSNQRPAPQAPPAPSNVILRIGVAILLGIHGIALVHAREGWFVVGGGRNGVELSLLLILSLVLLFLSYRPQSDLAAGGRPVA